MSNFTVVGSDCVEEVRPNSSPPPTAAVSFGSLFHVTGRAGEDVQFTCSDWNTWTDVKRSDKFFCGSPCPEDGRKRLQSAYGETRLDGRTSITNNGNELLVRITKLQIGDAGKYSCGVKRFLQSDRFIQVNLEVLEGKFIHSVTFSLLSVFLL